MSSVVPDGSGDVTGEGVDHDLCTVEGEEGVWEVPAALSVHRFTLRVGGTRAGDGAGGSSSVGVRFGLMSV